jgi:site-specific DNA recombinase
VYYRCHTSDCLTKCIREDAVENAILQKLEQLRFSDAEQAYFSQTLPALDQQVASKEAEIRRSITLQLDQARDRLNRLTDAYLDRMLDQGAYMERKRSLVLEQADLEEKLVNASRDGGQGKRLEKVLELANNAVASYKSALPEQKRELLKILTSNREVEAKIVMIELCSPFREIALRTTFTLGAQERGVTRDPKSSDIAENVLNALLPKIFEQYRNYPTLLA